MLGRLSSSLSSFKTVDFRPGLNLILAERSPESGARDTRNSAGKTSLVEVLHFLLGANAHKDSLLRRPSLLYESFTLELLLDGQPLEVTRSGNNASKVFVDGPAVKALPLRPKRDRATGRLAFSNNVWRGVLGGMFFGLPADKEDLASSGHPSFRSLFAYFARREGSGGFNEPTRQSSKQGLGDYQVGLSYLLGLDWRIARDLEVLRGREKSLKELRRVAAAGDLGTWIGRASDLRSEWVVARNRAETLRQRLAAFRVVPEFKNLEREASELTRQMGTLADSNALDLELIAEMEAAQAQEAAPSYDALSALYEEAGVVLPGTVSRRFEEVSAFHESVIANRRQYLEAELIDARRRIEDRDLRIQGAGERRARLMDALQAGGALEQYSALQREVAQRDAKAEALHERFLAATRLESEKTELEIERAQIHARLQRDFTEQFERVEAAILGFEEVSRQLYEQAGRLALEPTANGPEVSIRISGADSKGIGNMQTFCLDMMLLKSAKRQGFGLDFLVHDSHLFDGVDSRQVARALEVGAQVAADLDIQYVVTLNSDALPAEWESGFDVTEHILPVDITDEHETGGLFGIRFD